MTHVNLGGLSLQHDALTGGFLAPEDLPDPGISPIDFHITNPPDLGTLKESFAIIAEQNEPKVSTDLFERIRTNINKAFDSAREERETLGGKSLDLEKSINEQIDVRESQRAETFGFIDKINTRISDELIKLGDTTKDSGGKPFGFISDFVNNPILLGLGTTGLIVGGIVLILLLKK